MKTTGGFAFPFQPTSPQGEPYSPDSGMTLRDYFAGQAIAGMLASEQDGSFYEAENAAQRAYKFADSMIAERSKE